MNALVQIAICAVLPISCLLIVYGTRINYDNKRAKILIKAIESGKELDTSRLTEALRPPKKSEREVLNLRLLRGCIFSFIGIGLCLVSIISLCMGLNMADDPVAVPLVFGGVSLALGISYLVVYGVTRKHIK